LGSTFRWTANHQMDFSFAGKFLISNR